MTQNTKSTNDQANAEFEAIVRPVIEFMNTMHPHHTLIVDSTRAELLEGERVFRTDDYLQD
ncbi:hypothetical protein [Rathayibacter sp. VKM Ac-2805]|uniref:hypothetical protein n=1 Tax=Rathayibacter sp. VKM Ac-2805 TaxID=2609258 RepID=UPI0013202929|nr:hypothetical protein [Rathayibacter sp. VKM Ac-2805]QHC73800.1 hypothetical protein GSU40_08990 [Rathayibacter sp. VKM Ac-2805]